VEWVKEVNHAIMRGPIAAANTVTLIDGIDTMNKESANAMLKTLEEPPSGTLLILLTDRPQAVLPTIVSRCQTIRFGWAPPEMIRDAVGARFGSSVSENVVSDAIRYCGGSLGRAMDLCAHPPMAVAEEVTLLLEECIEADWLKIAAHVDELTRLGEYERFEQLLLRLIHYIRTEFLQTIVDSTTYFDDAGASAAAQNGNRAGSLNIKNPETAGRYLAVCREALAGIRAYGNASIVLVNCIFSFMEIMHE
jgi:hypothetical protein